MILHELSFNKGDSVCQDILPNKITESQINLERTPLFNYVTFSTDTINHNTLIVNIKVEERWYFIPIFTTTYADRNLNNWLKNKDWSRIKIGTGFEKYNFRGRNENLGVYLIYGYDEQISLYYKNIYFDEVRKYGASFYLKYYRRRETPYAVEEDKYVQIKLQNTHAMQFYGVSSSFFYRAAPNETHTIGAAVETRHLADSVILLNDSYLNTTGQNSTHAYLRYIYQKDMRDNHNFPMSGYRIKLFMQKTGLGFFPSSKVDFLIIRPQISNHFKFAKRFSLGNQLVGKKSFGSKQPFYLQKALGTEFNIRGYEYYVIHGNDFILSNNSLNFELIPKTIFTIKFIPLPKFNKIHFSLYLGAFWDMAYVRNTDVEYQLNNQLANTFLYSGGLSFNLLTYYDKLLRFDYSWNKLGEKGLFFHIIAPF